jgi:UDP-N-acetylmuramoyl-tripeptide--D-alanyl-D-alanine ligase
MGQPSLLRLIFAVAWTPQALQQLLAWIFWLQVKEYRRDRFGLLFRSREGLLNLGFPAITVKLLILLLAALIPSTALNLLAVVLLTALDFQFFINIATRRFRRPDLTLRSVLILLIGLAIIGGGLLLTLARTTIAPAVILFPAELLLLLAPGLGGGLTLPLALVVKQREIAQARRHLEAHKPAVIGITGSYGKTTTKEFVAQLLAVKYETAKTSGSENTELGIARKTLRLIRSSTKYFVVEMGAYTLGEIKAIVDIVHPQTAMVTGIEPQHLALFGSLERIIQAKSEIVAGLPPGGTALFNFSNPYCRQMADTARRERPDLRVLGYAVLDGQTNTPADLSARVLSATANGVRFEVVDGKETVQISAPVNGLHFVENLAGAILVARLNDLTWDEIQRGCDALQLPDKTMQVSELENKLTLIDDSHNSTPKAFISAVNYLQLFPDKKKIVITPGIIELGPETEAIHRQLGQHLREVNVDRVILTTKDFFAPLQSGLAEHAASALCYSDGQAAFRETLSQLGPLENLVILLEGRVPAYVLKVLKESRNV